MSRCFSASRSRAVTVGVVLVAVLVAVPATVAWAEGYRDVAGGVHAPSVDALISDSRGVLAGTGCASGRFCPDEPLARWMMAVWLVRALDRGDPEPAAGSGFVDVDSDEWWAAHTDRLADLGVTKGCGSGPPRYCPDGWVTRGQMASFLVRAFEFPDGEDGGFTDTGGSVHEASIDKLAAAGVTAGCGPARYCPEEPVTRAQMATFLARVLKLVPLPAAVTGAGDYHFAYSVTYPDGRDGTWVMDSQGAKKRLGKLYNPVWSPDGKFIAYEDGSKFYPIVGATVHVMEADGSNRRQLLAGPGPDATSGHLGGFQWSPDGRRIVYTGQDIIDGVTVPGTWVEDADGGNKRQLNDNVMHPVWDFYWSHDGRSLSHQEYDGPGGSQPSTNRWLVDDFDTLNRLRVDDARYVYWTPDSQRMFFTARYDKDPATDEVWIMDADGGNRRKLYAGGLSPVWSPDSSRFVYRPRGGGIYIADANGTVLQTLVRLTCENMVWSADGVHIAIWASGGRFQIINAESGSVRRVTDGYVDPWDFKWSFDGRQIAYAARDSEGFSTLWVEDAQGGNRRKLAEHYAESPFWSADDERIAYLAVADSGHQELWIVNSDGSNMWRVAESLGKPTKYGENYNTHIEMHGWIPG